MTVFFTQNTIDALISSASPYLVAFSSSGLQVGSVSIAWADLQGYQAQMAVWGDLKYTWNCRRFSSWRSDYFPISRWEFIV